MRQTPHVDRAKRAPVRCSRSRGRPAYPFRTWHKRTAGGISHEQPDRSRTAAGASLVGN